eukprot:scaffold18990_cov152-Isochrysis_galbana.AAC.1
MADMASASALLQGDESVQHLPGLRHDLGPAHRGAPAAVPLSPGVPGAVEAKASLRPARAHGHPALRTTAPLLVHGFRGLQPTDQEPRPDDQLQDTARLRVQLLDRQERAQFGARRSSCFQRRG